MKDHIHFWELMNNYLLNSAHTLKAYVIVFVTQIACSKNKVEV